MASLCFVTGATGFVGGHVAEAFRGRGWDVRTLARPGSDAAFLEAKGVAVHRGDLTDPAAVRAAVEGVDVVVHCAAKVGDWGPVDDYRAVNVEATRTLLDAVVGRPLRRFVHLSSLGVYAARHHHGTDESEPPPDRHVDGYTQTKVEAEKLALEYQRSRGVPVVALRPGFVYGPRDRTVVPQLIANLQARRLRWIGGGRGALNTIYVDNLVEAVFLAVDCEKAVGEVYNLTDGEAVSKRRFLMALVDGLGLPAPRPVGVPVWLAQALANWMEKRALTRGAKEAPLLTAARVKFLGLNLDFSIEKAKRDLGYRPRVGFDEAMARTVAWYKNRASEAATRAGGPGA